MILEVTYNFPYTHKQNGSLYLYKKGEHELYVLVQFVLKGEIAKMYMSKINEFDVSKVDSHVIFNFQICS